MRKPPLRDTLRSPRRAHRAAASSRLATSRSRGSPRASRGARPRPPQPARKLEQEDSATFVRGKGILGVAVSSRARGAVVWEPIRVSTPTRVKTRVTPRSRPATKSREGARRTRMRGSTGNISRSSSRISGMMSFFMAAAILRTTAHARRTCRGNDPPVPHDDKGRCSREDRNKTIRTGRARFKGYRP